MFESLGHYKILDRIGAGGMGEVYRARDTRLGRTVAIKVLASDVATDPDRRDRFVHEARASAALSHPNIAALYEIGEDQDQLFLVFEFVPGETLQSVIGGRALNPRRAINLAVQIADALADAHAEGIVHRDIKPANIIVTPKGNAKILDFGLATWTAGGAERALAADAKTMVATKAGTTLGTVAYMSPEQALGERVDHRTDIFSLGIVLFEMLTGRLPFSGATPTALALQIVQAQAPPLTAVNRSLPAELNPIVAKALAKSLEQRYESAATLAAELRSVAAILDVRADTSEAATDHVPVGALPPRRSYGGWILLALMLAGLGAAAWMTRDAIERLWRRTVGPSPAPTIAVMPLELAGADASQTYFADGLTEDLITRLGQTPGLKVFGRSATRAYRGRAPREVAKELGAGVVLTGSLRPSADVVKVSLELIDPTDGTAIWSNQYTREVKDIFAVQAEIADEVAQAMRVKLQPTPSSVRARSRLVDRRAYELYLQGRLAAAERRVADAIRSFEQAIAADAGLAEAFAGMVEALHFEGVFNNDLDSLPRRQRLRAAAERAYQLDPDLSQANLAMALATDTYSEAWRHFRRAVELDPSYSQAYHLIGDQLHDLDPQRAIEFWRRSMALDPRMDANHGDIAATLILLDRHDEARQELASAGGGAAVRQLQNLVRLAIDLDQRRYEEVPAVLSANPWLRSAEPFWLAYVVALRTIGRTDEAFAEATQFARKIPASCAARALLAGLMLDRGQVASGRQLANPILQSGREESAPSPSVRCAAFAAAATDNAADAAALIDRAASRADLLRFWSSQVAGYETGRMAMRGRQYPWMKVVDKPPVVAARQRLEAAYARERETAKSALAGLP